MKPRRLLALAAAIISSAVAYGIHLFSRQEPQLPVTSAKDKTSTVTGRDRTAPADSPSAIDRRQRTEVRTSEKSAPREGAAANLKRIVGAPALGSGRVLSESQWRENAARVELEANHELKRLTALLALDPYQQDQVFDTLARNSPHWLPGMQAGGSNMNTGGDSTALAGSKTRAAAVDSASTALSPAGGSLVSTPSTSGQVENADLTAFLNPEQQQAIADDAADREEWWAEVLPQLLPPSVTGETTATTADGVTSSDTTDAPATKEFDGGEVLIEE